uniref:Ig-like domain-containing protein n=1 Tax=Periophthalmus magnuspinnatus TaxID=409849 RepID=A0A3B3ZBS3_9GOBI
GGSSTHLFLCFSLKATQKVSQTPLQVIKFAGDSTNEMKCSHKQSKFDDILWYKQDKSATFKFLGFLVQTNAYLEHDVEDRIHLSRNGDFDATLSIRNLTVEDSAVYFCAVRQHTSDAQ